MRRKTLRLLVALGFAGGPATAGITHLSYSCDLQGAEGAMTVALESKDVTALIPGIRPGPTIFSGVRPTGETEVFTAGEIKSSTAHYVFTGWNYFATFSDVRQGGQFIVRFDPQPSGDLVLVINPFQSPEYQGMHYCRKVG